MPDWTGILRALDEQGVATDGALVPEPVAGGDISAAWRVATGAGKLFIKTGPRDAATMFAAETEGLAELRQSATLRVPDCIAAGETGDGAFLALEWLDLSAADSQTEVLLGEGLAAMHRNVRQAFGWHRDNMIGLTPQVNTPADSWIEFFAEQRLLFQLRLATDKGYGRELKDRGDRLLRRLPVYFAGYEPAASLLHGDLWGGNAASVGGEPVLFDPAVYYGDRETDIAMTRLFGGFGASFYTAYETAWPLAEGHEQRQHLYQLYHVLNHLNLFGSAYLARATSLIDQLLKA